MRTCFTLAASFVALSCLIAVSPVNASATWMTCSGESMDFLPPESIVITGVGDMVFSSDHALNTRSLQAMVPHLTDVTLDLSQSVFMFGNLEGPITELVETSKPSIHSNKFPQVDPTGKAIAVVWNLNLLGKQKLKDFVPAQPTWGALSETDY